MARATVQFYFLETTFSCLIITKTRRCSAFIIFSENTCQESQKQESSMTKNQEKCQFDSIFSEK